MFAALMLMVLGLGCGGDVREPAESAPWTPPTYTGPPDDDSTWSRGTPGTAADPEDTASPELNLSAAIFAETADPPRGILWMLVAELSCDEAFGGDDPPAEGLFLELTPASEGAWLDRFVVCGEPPCFTGAWSLAGEEGTAEGEISVVDYDVHGVTVEWELGVTSGVNLEMRNCGEAGVWR